MRISLISALGAVGVALSVIAAPLAGATTAGQHIKPPQNCTTVSAGSQCTSPGNVQINDAPPLVQNFPMYGSFPWVL